MRKYFISLLAGILFFLFETPAQVPSNIQKPVKKVQGNKSIPGVDINSDIILSRSVVITPSTLSNLCPWIKTRGDNNFEENPVTVTVNISFRGWTTGKDSVLLADVSFSGEENGGDRSSVKGNWKKEVYRAPAGWVIKQISNGTSSLATYFSFTANPAEPYSIKACNTRNYKLSRNNLGYSVPAPTVEDIEMAVHLNKQDDFDGIESTCGCGFKIVKLEFKPLTILIEKAR